MNLADIYPELDNLSPFIHPKYNKTYSFLSLSNLFDLCYKIITRIVAAHISNVVVLESGATPLARICQMMAKKYGYSIDWFYVKIPRDIENCLCQTLLYYDSDSSRELLQQSNRINSFFQSVHHTLKQAKQYIEAYTSHNPYLSSIRETTKNSKLANILKNTFIIFDEYIDSGKTLVNSIKFFYLFAENLDYQILCYLTKFSDGDSGSLSALYSIENEEVCYDKGVYPFENRIDLIGYFFHINTKILQKTYVQELSRKKTWHNQNYFLNLLYGQLEKHSILAKVKLTAKIRPVADYIASYHLIQFLLFALEKLTIKDEKVTEFYYQLFDMYGPIWSPLPDDYHWDFLQTFAANEKQFTELINNDIIKNYLNLRITLVSEIANICVSRRKKFWHETISYVNGRSYEPG